VFDQIKRARLQPDLLLTGIGDVLGAEFLAVVGGSLVNLALERELRRMGRR
jgi:hypothetical protein